MKIYSNLIAVFFLLVGVCGYSQSSEVTYYKNEKTTRIANESSAKYKKTITKFQNGNVTTEIENIQTKTIISSETYRGTEPYGIWIIKANDSFVKLDFDFDLVYSDDCNCENQKATTDNEQNKIIEDLKRYLASKMIYPQKALEEEIEGRVKTSFKINDKGEIINYSITKSKNILLDKEAIRVLRLIKFSNFDLTKIKVINNCFCIPMFFKLL